MSIFLSRLGRLCSRHRLIVLGAWLLIFAVLTGAMVAGKANGGAGTAAQSVSETEASRTLDRVKQEFPSTGSGEPAKALQLVFQSAEGQAVTDPANADAINRLINRAAELPGVKRVSDPLDPSRPYVSADKSLAVATLTYGDLNSVDEKEGDYQAALDLKNQAPDHLRVELGGNLVDPGAPAPGPGEIVGVLVAFVVLLLTFGSLVAAGFNLLLAAFGVGVGLVGVLAYGAFNPVGDTVIILAAMLGLAVGIDYSLFILSRFRTELRDGKTVQEAVSRATGTAGTAVVFAGLTVIIALVGLSVVKISFITEMGMAAAFAVLIAVLIALTLLPVVMRTLGRRVLPRHERKLPEGTVTSKDPVSGKSFLNSWSKVVVKRPLMAIVAGVIMLVVVALPALDLKTAFNVPGGVDPASTERAAYNLILDEFGGTQSPIVILAEGANVDTKLPAVEQDLANLAGVQRVIPGKVNASGNAALLTVIPKTGPIDDLTKELVTSIRKDYDTPGVTLSATGEAVIYIDQDAQLNLALIQYLAVIVVLSLVLLTIIFRSLLIPIVATLGFLLSVAASFGGSVAVFQWGWLDPIIAAPQGDPMLSMLPILLVGVLFGLAMDYQVFLVSRIQEMHSKGMNPKEAIVQGFTRSAPVLVAAGTIMAVVFAGFASSTMAVAASIAFGLVVGVVADVFVVRLILMPAVLSLLGKAAWWMPKWMDRIIPNIDIEGHSLDKAPEIVEREPGLVNS
ncbi:MMPL family transporter [Arthrobacter sp. NQ7]|uniref:MMPL family transporter n=1 Tax=Arthrobacter sp. NQ7 TaxID=3032303 RepID=UPI00240F9A03|nr:MMPL family transporter [Arthrobacter sp. NQ7]MDJ0458644.1 MMPL family transporter [Arthrobacter sp. NQ7]